MIELDKIIFYLLTLYVGIMSWIGNREVKRVDKLVEKVDEHTKEIQSNKDINGVKLDNIRKDFDEFRHEMKDELKNIASQIHKEKNQEQQMNTVLTLILKQLEAKDARDI